MCLVFFFLKGDFDMFVFHKDGAVLLWSNSLKSFVQYFDIFYFFAFILFFIIRHIQKVYIYIFFFKYISRLL